MLLKIDKPHNMLLKAVQQKFKGLYLRVYLTWTDLSPPPFFFLFKSIKLKVWFLFHHFNQRTIFHVKLFNHRCMYEGINHIGEEVVVVSRPTCEDEPSPSGVDFVTVYGLIFPWCCFKTSLKWKVHAYECKSSCFRASCPQGEQKNLFWGWIGGHKSFFCF